MKNYIQSHKLIFFPKWCVRQPGPCIGFARGVGKKKKELYKEDYGWDSDQGL